MEPPALPPPCWQNQNFPRDNLPFPNNISEPACKGFLANFPTYFLCMRHPVDCSGTSLVVKGMCAVWWICGDWLWFGINVWISKPSPPAEEYWKPGLEHNHLAGILTRPSKWSYYKRLLDYKTPYFRLEFLLEHRWLWDHRILSDDESSYFRLKWLLYHQRLDINPS